MGDLISGRALQNNDSALDEVITISMPTDIESQPVPDNVRLEARNFVARMNWLKRPMNCIYGGRDDSVSVDVVNTHNENDSTSVHFHEIPKMTHRNIGHFKAEIKAILDALI